MGLEVNSENLAKVLSAKSITILQFSAEWCGPCKMLTPIMLKLADENSDKDLTIGKVNVDVSSEIGSKYSVRNIPTLVFLKDGVEVSRTTGIQPKEALQMKIDALLN
jgi:thioredoxin 1